MKLNTEMIKRIVVISSKLRTDVVLLYLDAPTPFPKTGWEPCLELYTASGYGATWVREAFSGREPDEIIVTDE